MVIISKWTGFRQNPQSTKYAFNKLVTQLKPPSSSTKKKLIIQHIPPQKKQNIPKVLFCVNFPPIISQIVLSGVLHVIGKLSEAAPLFARALEGRETELGQHHPDTLATVNNFAVLLEATLETPESGNVLVFFFSKKGENDLMNPKDRS